MPSRSDNLSQLPDAEDRLANELRKGIASVLQKQGFIDEHGNAIAIDQNDKDTIRAMHRLAVVKKQDLAKDKLLRYESAFLKMLASGAEVDPHLIEPHLVEVLPGSTNELLFRYLTLHWSVPVSSGYGRRMRFLLVDNSNGKIMGLLGLGDPVFSLAARDQFIGWSHDRRRIGLRHVMDAFVLGAVPPYSNLLCGKLIALIALCSEVSVTFQRKYGTSLTGIAPRLALVSTTSAFGRSSMYNRLSLKGQRYWHPCGFTQGSGEVQFSNGLYADIRSYAVEHCVPTAKNPSWGSGFRNRREVIRKCLGRLDLPLDWMSHGIRRHVYIGPTASNSLQFLRGEHKVLRDNQRCLSEMFHLFRDRWLLPRAQQNTSYHFFDPESMRLWSS